MLEILSCNNADEKIVIDQEIRDLVLKYKPEFAGLNVKQRDIVVRFLEQELIK